MTRRTFAERWIARQARLAGKDEEQAVASCRLRKEAGLSRGKLSRPGLTRCPEKPVRLWSLGVSVEHDGVYTLNTAIRRRLGDLAGAAAQMGSSSSSKHTLGTAAGAAVNPITLPLAPFLALRKQVSAGAFIVFANGDVHPVTVKGNQSAINDGEADVLRFNVLAVQAARAEN